MHRTAPPPSQHWNSKEKCRIRTVPASNIPVEVDESQKINATSAVFEKGNRKVLGRIKIFVLLYWIFTSSYVYVNPTTPLPSIIPIRCPPKSPPQNTETRATPTLPAAEDDERDVLDETITIQMILMLPSRNESRPNEEPKQPIKTCQSIPKTALP